MDLEDIRNCSCEYALQNLLKLGVVEVVGRKDSIGHPALFGTTDNFLKRFQISSLDELPDYDGLIDKIKKLHGDDDAYLFKKDVYNEADDPEYNGENQTADNAETVANSPDGKENVSIFDAVDNTFGKTDDEEENSDPEKTADENDLPADDTDDETA